MKAKWISALALWFVAFLAGEDGGEGQLSLNGDWKFYAIYGEGSNYMNIREGEGDVVIDNRDVNVEVNGTWNSSETAPRNTAFYGRDFQQHNFTLSNLQKANTEDDAYFRFLPKFEKSGYYEAFTRYPFASHLTAQYKIKHSEGLTTRYVSQRVFCNEWNSLGIYKFNRGDESYIELSAIVSGSVAADAVMFREISAEKYQKAKQEPSQVFLNDYDDSGWHRLKVPGHWGMLNAFSNYTGKGWYRKTFEVPDDWAKESDERLYLKFGGVYHLSTVYLNGKFIGRNRGGFTPFEFEVSDALNFEGRNVIAVQADNSAIVGATWNWGGIIREVTLTKTKDVRIDYQYVHAEPDLSIGSARLSLKVRVENRSSVVREIDVEARILDTNEIARLRGSVRVDANSLQDLYLQTELPAEAVELWHFDKPKLYEVETRLSENGVVLNKKADRFGIRKVELTDSQLLLNGEAVRLAGFNRVSEHRFWGSSEPLHVLERDVDLMKEAGANFTRIMHGTQNEMLLEVCDRKGLLIFEEINVRDLDNDEFRAQYYPVAKLEEENGSVLNPREEEILMLDEPYVKLREVHEKNVTEDNYFLAKYWLKGMIERDFNHPSVIGWSVGNELNNHYEYGKAVIDYVKRELDPYRLVTCVSNSGQKEEYTPETDPNTFVDLIMHNMYRWQGEPQEILDTLRSKWPDKPIFISEFGFDPFPSTELDGDKEEFSEWTEHYRFNNEYVIGASMWTFNDYRSAYAGTSAEENRVWGVINSWRQKRRLFDRIKGEHASVRDLEISNISLNRKSADVRMLVRGRGDYPSFSMRDYELEYTFVGSEGELVYRGAVDLPAIEPNDGEWRGTITWPKLSSEAHELRLSLRAPTGHSRYDKRVYFKKSSTPKVTEVIEGVDALRILFDPVPNASEYFVAYSKEGESDTHESHRTIGKYIDIGGLEEGVTYCLRLYAINDIGRSDPFELVHTKLGQRPLPPVIWDAFITDGKLVVGYSSDFFDGDYTVQFGSSEEELEKAFSSNVRGMVIVELEGESKVYLRMKRTLADGEESQWSEIREAVLVSGQGI